MTKAYELRNLVFDPYEEASYSSQFVSLSSKERGVNHCHLLFLSLELTSGGVRGTPQGSLFLLFWRSSC